MSEFEMNDAFSIEELESLVFAAGDYVEPSADLRPRVMESAAHLDTQIRRARWSGLLLLAALVLGLIATPVVRAAQRSEGLQMMPSQDGVHAIAARISDETGCSLDWGMVRAYWALRGRVWTR